MSYLQSTKPVVKLTLGRKKAGQNGEVKRVQRLRSCPALGTFLVKNQ